MIIKFKKEMTLEIFTTLWAGCDRSLIRSSETFNAGEELDIDICDGLNPPDSREIQFAGAAACRRSRLARDGSVSCVTPDFWQGVEVVKE